MNAGGTRAAGTHPSKPVGQLDGWHRSYGPVGMLVTLYVLLTTVRIRSIPQTPGETPTPKLLGPLEAPARCTRRMPPRIRFNCRLGKLKLELSTMTKGAHPSPSQDMRSPPRERDLEHTRSRGHG